MNAGFVIWLTGLPASGKTTLAQALESRLASEGLALEVLDGDEVRSGLSADLGFSKEDREEHSRRVVFVSKLLVRNGINVIVPLISPYQKSRDFARRELGPFFTEVWVSMTASALLGTNPMPWDLIAVGSAVAVILALTGAFYFRRTERIFADVV